MQIQCSVTNADTLVSVTKRVCVFAISFLNVQTWFKNQFDIVGFVSLLRLDLFNTQPGFLHYVGDNMMYFGGSILHELFVTCAEQKQFM